MENVMIIKKKLLKHSLPLPILITEELGIAGGGGGGGVLFKKGWSL